VSQLKKDGAQRDFLLFPGALGDFLCFLPSALALAEAGREVVLAARPSWLSLIAHPRVHPLSLDHPQIVRLYGSEVPEQAEIFSGVERVFSWSGHAISGFAAQLAHASRAREVNVFAFRGMAAGEHAVDYYARCLGVRPVPLARSWFRTSAGALEQELRAFHAAAAPKLLIHAGSGSRAKNWQGFAAVAQRWREERGGIVVEIRGPAEQERSERLLGAQLTLENRDLPELAAWLDSAPLYLGNDSGVSHLAAIFAKRAVVLFGPTDPRVWAPRGSGTLVVSRPQPCRQCGPEVFCTHRLAPDEVWEALHSL